MKKRILLFLSLCTFIFSCSSKEEKQEAPLTVWTDVNSSGQSKVFYESAGFIGGDWNDQVSSLKVSEGYTVNFYQHADFKGEKLTLKGPINYNCNPATNDSFSSLEVIKE